MSAIVTSDGKIVYYDDAIVTFDFATAIASVAPSADRTLAVGSEGRALVVLVEDRTVVV